eukprot:6473492-Amphidinium_carterae.1
MYLSTVNANNAIGLGFNGLLGFTESIVRLEDDYVVQPKTLGSGYNGEVYLASSKQNSGSSQKFAVKGTLVNPQKANPVSSKILKCILATRPDPIVRKIPQPHNTSIHTGVSIANKTEQTYANTDGGASAVNLCRL